MRMTREILDIATKLRKIISVHGFGSAFRSTTYNDIDLLVVFESHTPNAFNEYIEFLRATECLQSSLGSIIDVTALTATEAAEMPLRENNRLVALYKRKTIAANL